MIHENVQGVALKLRELAGAVTPAQWETIRSACRVLDQAAEDARNLENRVALAVVAINDAAAPLAMKQ